MGEIADDMLDGTLDYITGEYIGRGQGFPRSREYFDRNAEEERRMNYAKKKFKELNIDVVTVSHAELHLVYKEELVKFYPYTGWHTGKSIKDGRGIQNLLNQIKNG